MCTYLKLEASSDGHLLQSSLTVPPSGLLPRPQQSEDTPEEAKLYSEALFTPYVTVAVDGLNAPQIASMYFPEHLKGRGLFKLLLPLSPGFIGLFLLYITLTSPTTFNHATHHVVDTITTVLIILLFFLPAYWWTTLSYRQGLPSVRVQNMIRRNYPNIPIHYTHEEFITYTPDERTQNDN